MQNVESMGNHYRRALSIALMYCASCAPEYETPAASPSELYPQLGNLWPTGIVPVCWESDGRDTEKMIAERAIRDTWEKEAAILTVGWGRCGTFLSVSPEVRIRTPENPNAQHGDLDWSRSNIGVNGHRFLYGSMTLNFSRYDDKPDAARFDRIRFTAVHEFGHALGFEHEQDHPDSPDACAPEYQGYANADRFGAFDIDSVMNYCRPRAGWRLSIGDRNAVRALYGPRSFGGGAGDYLGALVCSQIAGLTGRSGEQVDSIGLTCGDGANTWNTGGLGGGLGRDFGSIGCGPGEVAVGVHGRMGDSLDALGLVCTNPITRLGRNYTPTAGGDGGHPFDWECPHRQLLTGFHVFGGSGVDAIEPICTEVPWTRDFGYRAGWRVPDHPRSLADVDGDGDQDIVGFFNDEVRVARFIDDAIGYSASVRWSTEFTAGWNREMPRFLADANGDGRADIVGFHSRGVRVALSNGDAFGSSAEWSSWFGFDHGFREAKHVRALADVDGNSLPDIVGFFDDGVYVALNTGASFERWSRWSASYGYNQGWRIEQHPRMLADVNGDGLMDVVGMGNAGVWVSVSEALEIGPDGERLQGPKQFALTGPTPWLANFGYDDAAGAWRVERHPRLVADVNGDGMADVVGFGDSGVWVSRSQRTGLASPEVWSDDFGFDANWRLPWHARFLADANADGKADIFAFGAGEVWQASSMAAVVSSFAPAHSLVEDFTIGQGWDPRYHLRIVTDINGDGRADVVGFGHDGVFVRLML